MKKILFILLLCSGYVNSQTPDLLLASYQQVSDPVYFVGNAATPTTDENDFDGWEEHLGGTEFVLEVESSQVQDGSYAIKARATTDITSAASIRLELTGLKNATSYTVTGYIRVNSASAMNCWPRLHLDDGWVATDQGSLINSATYTSFSVTATTDATTAWFEAYSTISMDNTEYFLVDNIVVTEN